MLMCDLPLPFLWQSPAWIQFKQYFLPLSGGLVLKLIEHLEFLLLLWKSLRLSKVTLHLTDVAQRNHQPYIDAHGVIGLGPTR